MYVPLRVLKSNKTHEFSPPLLRELNLAIDSLMTALGKVVFEFVSVFWSTKIDRFMSLAQQDDDVSKPWSIPVYAYRMTGQPALITPLH